MNRARCRLAAAALAFVLCAPAACSRAAPPRSAPGFNVLLITIDTLRADALGAYGNQSAATPVIDRLAQSGVRFRSAHAHSVVTLPSHASILSGLYPFHHGVRENAGFRFPPATDTLATLLKARGYRTGAFVSAFPLDTRFGLSHGFDVYDDRYGKSQERTAFRMPERPGAETVRRALDWIGDLTHQTDPADRPWFAWVHLYEPHFPYTPPQPFATRFQSTPYAGEVAAADAALASLVTPFIDQGASGRTLIVLTGDHGEGLGDHGEMTHGLFAYEATLHIPLIVFAPSFLPPRVVDAPVRHVDVLPTILDAVGVTLPPTIDGRSIVDAARGSTMPPAPSYFESLSASLNRGWAPLYGVLRGSMKYIDLPIPELYDLAADPGEQHTLVNANREDLSELQHLLTGMRAEDRGVARASETAETRERLRSLGYVTTAAAPKTQYTDRDDPKRLVGLDREIEEVVSMYQRGDLSNAIARGEQVVRERPDMPLSLVHLAFLYNEAGNHRGAADAAMRALALNPADQDTVALVGAYLTEAGRAKDAVTELAQYIKNSTPDVDVLIAYGVALATIGRSPEALAVFERARSLDTANALPLVNIATVHMMSGDKTRAAQAFEAALQVDPAAARAHNGLGVIAAERGDNASAIAHWERAVALDPKNYETLYNLGDLLVRLGRPSEARPYWKKYTETAPPALEASDIEHVKRWLASHR